MVLRNWNWLPKMLLLKRVQDLNFRFNLMFVADIDFIELYLSLPMVKKDRIKADTNIKPAWTKRWKVVIWIIVG